ALNNRRWLWIYREARSELVRDMERVLSIARELGNPMIEHAGELNYAHALQLFDVSDEALLHAQRAVDIEERLIGEGARPEGALVLARLLAIRGEHTAAREVIERIQARQARARAEGHSETILLPWEQVLCEMVDLATRDVLPGEWT